MVSLPRGYFIPHAPFFPFYPLGYASLNGVVSIVGKECIIPFGEGNSIKY